MTRLRHSSDEDSNVWSGSAPEARTLNAECCDHCGRRLSVCLGDTRCGPKWPDGPELTHPKRKTGK